MNTLNEWMAAKGMRPDLRIKRVLAQGFGLPMDKGTPEQESTLLRALQAGEMASRGTVTESFKVQAFNFEQREEKGFETAKEAEAAKMEMEAQGWRCRVSRLITISTVL